MAPFLEKAGEGLFHTLQSVKAGFPNARRRTASALFTKEQVMFSPVFPPFCGWHLPGDSLT
jgi:hypothetical protein